MTTKPAGGNMFIMRKVFWLLAIMTVILAGHGCTLVKATLDKAFLERSSLLTGKVTITGAQNGQVVVGIYTREGDRVQIIDYTALQEQGQFFLMVPAGHYHLYAFADLNGNFILDRGEPVGGYDGEIEAARASIIEDLNIKLEPSDPADPDVPFGLKLTPVNVDLLNTFPGMVVDIDEYEFSLDYAKVGYWAPGQFATELGVNIYFQEEYDPHKIPVLFIHGAVGTPQNFKTFSRKLDHAKYQAWFFHYPSGAGLRNVSKMLHLRLGDLHRKYGFTKLHLVAHSMGGLLARNFLVNYGEFHSYIRSFTSICTPWAGERLAVIGVKYSPVVIRSWEDMAPQSHFIEGIFQKTLPAGMHYYLIFGFTAYDASGRPDHDGTVTVESQLDPRAQKDAEQVIGFNEDHTDILDSGELIDTFEHLIIHKKPASSN